MSRHFGGVQAEYLGRGSLTARRTKRNGGSREEIRKTIPPITEGKSRANHASAENANQRREEEDPIDLKLKENN